MTLLGDSIRYLWCFFFADFSNKGCKLRCEAFFKNSFSARIFFLFSHSFIVDNTNYQINHQQRAQFTSGNTSTWPIIKLFRLKFDNFIFSSMHTFYFGFEMCVMPELLKPFAKKSSSNPILPNCPVHISMKRDRADGNRAYERGCYENCA